VDVSIVSHDWNAAGRNGLSSRFAKKYSAKKHQCANHNPLESLHQWLLAHLVQTRNNVEITLRALRNQLID